MPTRQWLCAKMAVGREAGLMRVVAVVDVGSPEGGRLAAAAVLDLPCLGLLAWSRAEVDALSTYIPLMLMLQEEPAIP